MHSYYMYIYKQRLGDDETFMGVKRPWEKHSLKEQFQGRTTLAKTLYKAHD